ncbi:hypothetical protein NA56DRAFT_264834 [Hyaloscypha hepaticicola]|uniref:Uncharacterized protein n=1 Tax=Hyaloscypha hepaticicola TaxID=2082293 RepID=A0A2J6PUK7_9HELO|nr:hypothetical protein NA56DRAFT_264834 [Hyaloscypha hepaticicola]
MIRLWTVSFRKLGTIRSDGQNTRLNLCLVVQRSVRESDSEHGAKELSRLSVLKTNFKPSMRSPVSAQNWISASRSLQTIILARSPSPQSQFCRYLNAIIITYSHQILESNLHQVLKTRAASYFICAILFSVENKKNPPLRDPLKPHRLVEKISSNLFLNNFDLSDKSFTSISTFQQHENHSPA